MCPLRMVFNPRMAIITVFIRTEAPSRIEELPAFGKKINIFSNFTSIDSYILSHAIIIFHKKSWMTEMTWDV